MIEQDTPLWGVISRDFFFKLVKHFSLSIISGENPDIQYGVNAKGKMYVKEDLHIGAYYKRTDLEIKL